MPERLLE